MRARDWRLIGSIGDNLFAMGKLNRRDFLVTSSAATLAATASRSFAATPTQRVLIGSGTPDGILAFDWDPVAGDRTEVLDANHSG